MARGRDLEVEQAVQAQIAKEKGIVTEQKMKGLEAFRAERDLKEQERQARLSAETWSCWCGIDHESGRRLTEQRAHSVTDPELKSPNSRLFVGGLSFNIDCENVAKGVVGILRLQDVDCSGLKFSPQTQEVRPRYDSYDPYADYWEYDDQRITPAPPRREFRGSCIVSCRDVIQARSIAMALHGHETFRRGRNFQRLAMRVSYFAPKTKEAE